MEPYPRIIVLRSGAVGDCILSTPVIAALRRALPASHITVLGDPFSADLFRNSPDIDSVLAYDSKQMSGAAYLRRMLALRMLRFSLLIDLHGNGRSFVQTLLVGGKQRLGFEIRSCHPFAYSERVPYRTDVHTVARQAEILKPLGIHLTEGHSPLVLELTPEEMEAADRLLESEGLARGSRFVVVHASAGVGRNFKQWIPERFAAVADRVQEDLGLAVVVTGQLDWEKEEVERLKQAARKPIIDLFGKTSLRMAAALLKRAEMYIGCDTGPMHLAAAVNTPIVALFGPTDPVRWHPWTTAPYRLVRADLPCSPCPGRTCDYDVRCMKSLEVDQVFQAVQEIHRAPVLSR